MAKAMPFRKQNYISSYLPPTSASGTECFGVRAEIDMITPGSAVATGEIQRELVRV
jgi:hypothetical protein